MGDRSTTLYTVNDFIDRFAGRPADIQGARGHFTVLVPVVDVGGEAHILYELRAAELDTQPGEVCFPGGRIEDGETRREAVLRETKEELGLGPEDVQIIAALDTFHPASGIVIYPFLAALRPEALQHMRPSPAEVSEAFLVPVSRLMEEPYRYAYELHMDLGEDFDYGRIGLTDENYCWRPMKAEIISWEYEGKYIWGLTAQITEHTLALLK